MALGEDNKKDDTKRTLKRTLKRTFQRISQKGISQKRNWKTDLIFKGVLDGVVALALQQEAIKTNSGKGACFFNKKWGDNIEGVP